MLTTINTPYRPEFCNHAGTYCLSVGDGHYYGSTTRLGSRRSDHHMKLRRGEHPNRAMQEAFNAAPDSFLFTVLATHLYGCRPSTTKLKKILRDAEQKLLDAPNSKGYRLNASSSATHNSGISEALKAKWANPTYRERQMAAMKSRKGVLVTQETRRKMSEAKKGCKNHNARPCSIQFEGKNHHFDCVAAAAAHFGVKQQIMQGWLQGLFGWPGSGIRKPRKSTEHLTGMTGSYKPNPNLEP